MTAVVLKVATVGVLGGVALVSASAGLGWVAAPALAGVLAVAAVEVRALARQARADRRECPAGDTGGPFTPDDFPFPDPVPGGANHTGGYAGWGARRQAEGEAAFAVVAPRAGATPQELEDVGLRLPAWGAATRVLGLDELLAGRPPATPAHLLLLPSPPWTEPVALVYVEAGAADERLGRALAAALDGAAIALVVSPAYYSMMNR